MANTSASGGYLVPTGADPVSDLGLDTVFQGLVSGVTGLPDEMVRQRVQVDDGLGRASARIPAQDVDWCAIGVTDEQTDGGVGGIQIHDPSGEGSSTLRRYTILTVMASFYGPRSQRNAETLRDGLSIAQNREALFLADIGLVGLDPIRLVPDLANNIPRRRADLAMRFRRRTDRTYAIRNLLQAQGAIRTEGNAQTFTTEP